METGSNKTGSKKFHPGPVPSGLLDAARKLRTNLTDAEHFLWFFLRRKQLGGFRFRRQHPVEKYVLDFYCPEARLAIELDGGQHNEELATRRDLKRSKLLEDNGIHVVRVWNHELFLNLEGVLQMILEALLERRESGNERVPPP